jgi:hypothetical protein
MFTFLRIRYLTLPLSFIQQELAFDSVTLAREFLMSHSSALFTNPDNPDSEKVLDCKPTFPQLTQAYEEKYRKVLIKGAI